MSNDVNTPVVGGGATEHLYTDTMGHVVISVSASGYKVGLAMLRSVDTTTGHEPAGNCNGYPVWDHVYTDEELASLRYDDDRLTYAYRGKDGTYKSADGRVTFGRARYYRNYAD